MHWSYDGNYFFISNNCAVESLKLLRSGSANPQLTGLDNITPNGLLEVLSARGLADTSVLNDKREALRLGYHFDSFRERYQAMFDVLRKQLPIKYRAMEIGNEFIVGYGLDYDQLGRSLKDIYVVTE